MPNSANALPGAAGGGGFGEPATGSRLETLIASLCREADKSAAGGFASDAVREGSVAAGNDGVCEYCDCGSKSGGVFSDSLSFSVRFGGGEFFAIVFRGAGKEA